MIKVTLLGDSIRWYYGQVVPGMLGEDYEICMPEENGRFAKYTLRGLFDWKEQMQGTRIVHWNNGLWDMADLFGDGAFTPEEEYESTVLRIADILLQRYDKVIFAATTPVSPDNTFHKNSIIEHYNARILPKLREKGVIINDLYTPIAADINRYISEDLIHPNPEGVQLLGGLVADAIRKAAAELNREAHCECGTADRNTAGAPV